MNHFITLLEQLCQPVGVTVTTGQTHPVLGTTIYLDNVAYDLVEKHMHQGSQLKDGWAIAAYEYEPSWIDSKAVEITIAEHENPIELVFPLVRYHLDWKSRMLGLKQNPNPTDLDALPYVLRSKYCYCKPHQTHCAVCACGKPGHTRSLEMVTLNWCDECYAKAVIKLQSIS